MAHLVLPDTQADPSINQKSYFFPALGQTNNETNEMYIEKRDKRDFYTILAT